MDPRPGSCRHHASLPRLLPLQPPRAGRARACYTARTWSRHYRQDLAPSSLPGTNMNTSWLLAMESLYRRLGRPATCVRITRGIDGCRRWTRQSYHVHRAISRAEWPRPRPAWLPTERWACGAGPGRGLSCAACPASAAASVRCSIASPDSSGNNPPIRRAGTRTLPGHHRGFEPRHRPAPWRRVGHLADGRGDMLGFAALDGARAFTAGDRNRRLSDERSPTTVAAVVPDDSVEAIPSDLGRYYPPEYYVIPRDRATLLAVAREPERYKLESCAGSFPAAGGRDRPCLRRLLGRHAGGRL